MIRNKQQVPMIIKRGIVGDFILSGQKTWLLPEYFPNLPVESKQTGTFYGTAIEDIRYPLHQP